MLPKSPKARARLNWTLAIASVVALAAYLSLKACGDAIAYFYTPEKALSVGLSPGQRIRLGGYVEPGSIKPGEGLAISFLVTDYKKTIEVKYDGPLPDLFREGQGVIAEGAFTSDGTFQAQHILAKHDENYQPPELKSIEHKKPEGQSAPPPEKPDMDL